MPSPEPDDSDQLLTPKEAAAVLKVSLRTFYSWRYESRSYPPAIKVGKHLRYRKSALDAWLDAQTESVA